MYIYIYIAFCTTTKYLSRYANRHIHIIYTEGYIYVYIYIYTGARPPPRPNDFFCLKLFSRFEAPEVVPKEGPLLIWDNSIIFKKHPGKDSTIHVVGMEPLILAEFAE